MDYQNLLNITLSLVSTVMGWFARELWSAVKELKTDLAKQAYTLQQSKLQQDFDVLKNKVNSYEEIVGDFEQTQLFQQNRSEV